MKFKYKPSLVAVATAVVIFNVTSCKEKEVTPPEPTNTELLVGVWDLLKIDGELLEDFEVEMEFEADGDLTYEFSYEYYGYTQNYTYRGDWSWGANEESIIVEIDNEDPTVLDLVKLDATDLWMDDEYGDTWELKKQ